MTRPSIRQPRVAVYGVLILAVIRQSDNHTKVCVDIASFEGTSNDSWTGGSIVSQLNPDILEKIKNCFQVEIILVMAGV